MRADRRTLKLTAVVLLWAAAARGAVLYWSPYPATLDGFFYVRAIEVVSVSGHVPTPIDWDRVGMTAFLASVHSVLSVEALRLLQPLSAVIGLGHVLAGIVLVRRIAAGDHGVSANRTRVGVALTGGVLAVEGLFVRRTGVPDEELVGLLLVVLVAYAFHRWLLTRRWQWGFLAGVFVLVLPPMHSLSATITLLALGIVGIIHAASGWRAEDGLRALGGLAFAVACAGGYYLLAVEVPALTLSYADRLLAQPRLLSAWTGLLAAGIVWFVRTSARIQRVVVGGTLLAWVGLLAVNLRTPVYVGTISTPPLLLALVLPLTGLIVAATLGIDGVADRGGHGAAVLGLFVAPVTLVGYFLTAGLSPEFFDALLRVQTFAHLPAAVIAGGFAATRLTRGSETGIRWRRFGRVAFVVVLLGAVVTAPLGFMALDTTTIPGTTSPREFAGTGFAAENTADRWASEGTIDRIARLYYDDSASIRPVSAWSRGGSAPEMPVLATPGWTDRGIHQYPRPPARVSPERFEEWRTTNHVVYTNGRVGDTGSYVLVVPAR